MRQKLRCGWASKGDAEYTRYHDEEWGRPVHDDRQLFEMLTLEGAQAGLSWATILRKRPNYRRAFAGFDPGKVARFDAKRRRRLLHDAGIVRNRLKIESTITNARAFLAVQDEYGSFDRYLWSFAKVRPGPSISLAAPRPAGRSPLSDAISKDLKKRGFRFVGSTIVHAFLQAVGVVNDHAPQCYLARRTRRGSPVAGARH